METDASFTPPSLKTIKTLLRDSDSGEYGLSLNLEDLKVSFRVPKVGIGIDIVIGVFPIQAASPKTDSDGDSDPDSEIK